MRTREGLSFWCPGPSRAELKKGSAERERLGVSRADRGALSRKPWGGSDDVFSSCQGVWQSLEGQRRGSLVRCQGPTNQQSTVNNHRATTLTAREPDSLAPHRPCEAGAGERQRDVYTLRTPPALQRQSSHSFPPLLLLGGLRS